MKRQEEPLRRRLRELKERYPRYGHLMLHGLFKTEGPVVNKKRAYRLYKELGLQVRTKRRKTLTRPRVPMVVPSRVNQRWSVDIMGDQPADRRCSQVLNIVECYSRECVGQVVDTSISGPRIARYLDQLKLSHGLHEVIVCDNGGQLTSKAMLFWSRESGVKLHFIQHGKPIQNTFVKRFNDRFRDSRLNQH